MIRLHYDELAELDMANAIDYYAAISPSLAHRFLDKAMEVEAALIRNPALFQKRYKEARQAHFYDFPYSLIYVFLEEEELIRVVAVFHASRDPALWQRRLA